MLFIGSADEHVTISVTIEVAGTRNCRSETAVFLATDHRDPGTSEARDIDGGGEVGRSIDDVGSACIRFVVNRIGTDRTRSTDDEIIDAVAVHVSGIGDGESKLVSRGCPLQNYYRIRRREFQIDFGIDIRRSPDDIGVSTGVMRPVICTRSSDNDI